jgi:spermidine synthase
VLLLLFFLSGLSGLIYQVVWVRLFSTAFGATAHTTSLVVAIFMLGLGAGSSLVGWWADRRYDRAPDSLLRAYGIVELVVAALGLAVSLALPHLQGFAATYATYVKDQDGWFVLSGGSYVAQAAMAFALLTPITVLMGGTLTLLIRHLVRADVESASGRKIAALYAVNTLGAAAGAFLTDFALVPALGLRQTQFTAVALNVVAGIGAIVLSRLHVTRPAKAGRYKSSAEKSSVGKSPVDKSSVASGFSRTGNGPTYVSSEAVAWTALALLLSGFAGMGMEILWLRHFNVLLGGFRSVFSLVITIMLIAMGLGSALGGAIAGRTTRPAHALMVVQAVLVVGILSGLASTSADAVAAAVGAGLPEFWFNARPMLIEIGVPALLMGTAFPLANAVIQHAERLVGRRAGLLYLANTVGAVCGSLAVGYVLLPRLGMQGSGAVLALAAGLTVAPLYLVSSTSAAMRRGAMLTATVAGVVSGVAIEVWLQQPDSFLLQRSLPARAPNEQLLSVREGTTEVVAVTEIPGRGRGLLTNGHAMSSTAPLDQRYMRALAHIPLVMKESSPPFLRSSVVESLRVLVIGFGVGNSTHAASLHPTVARIEVADLSREILEQASSFRAANGNVLKDPRVAVYVNDGRQHLQMQPAATYDLITLEPPPIAHAGVGALYSREFYELARTRLKPGGYLSQWLPAYQVPPETALAMVRAFIDVFPRAVLLSGTEAELLLVGTTGDRIDVDPERLARTLGNESNVLADLKRLDLGSVKEIVGAFMGSSETLVRATRGSSAVTDDRPLQEYGVRSVMASQPSGVPASLVDLPSASAWCPKCFNGEAATVPGLDAYLALMDEVYHSKTPDRKVRAAPGILDNTYLAAVLPDTDNVHNIVGVELLQNGRYDEAARQFREALKRREDSPDANRNLGTALAAMGNVEEAITYLQRAVRLAPQNEFARKELDAAIARSTASGATSSRRPPS